MLTLMIPFFIPIVLQKIDPKAVVILLMTHMLNYVFLILKNINVKVFNLTSSTNET